MNAGFLFIAAFLITMTLNQWNAHHTQGIGIDEANAFYFGSLGMACLLAPLSPEMNSLGIAIFMSLNVVILMTMYLRQNNPDVMAEKAEQEITFRVICGCLVIISSAILGVCNVLLNPQKPLVFEAAFSPLTRPLFYLFLVFISIYEMVQIVQRARLHLFVHRKMLRRLVYISSGFYAVVFLVLALRALLL